MSDEQPALEDGDLRLRPWTAADVEPTRLLHDDEIARWFDVPTGPPTLDGHAAWVAQTHGGTVSLESSDSTGSRFAVRFPLSGVASN